MSTPANELRILIAENHEVVRRGVRSVLEDRPNWNVCGEAETGAEAIEKAKALCPDLLLLDVALPDMATAEAIRQIVDVCPGIKIVALTAPESAELAAAAMVAGAKGLALTSEAASHLLLTVENLGRGTPFLSPGAVDMILSQLAKPKPSVPAAANLTARELEILGILANGRGNKEVAAALNISVKTVNVHRAAIMRKLKLHNYSELVHFAIQQGMAMIG